MPSLRSKTEPLQVSSDEKAMHRKELLAAYQGFKHEKDKVEAFESDTFYKVTCESYYLRFNVLN